MFFCDTSSLLALLCFFQFTVLKMDRTGTNEMYFYFIAWKGSSSEFRTSSSSSYTMNQYSERFSEAICRWTKFYDYPILGL